MPGHEAVDLRARPGSRTLRHEDGETHRQQTAGEGLSLLGPGARDREEPSFSVSTTGDNGSRDTERNASAMIVTRKHLHRRSFLKGMGAVVALPVLDAMTPALVRAAQAPVRLAFTYVPNGIVMNDWTPAAEGAAYEFTRIMKPLEPFRKDMLVLSGLAHRNGAALGDGPGDHARAGALRTSPASIRGRRPAPTSRTAFRPTRSPRSTSGTRHGSHRWSLDVTTRGRSATATPAIPARIPTAWPGVARPRRCRRRPIPGSCSSASSATSTPACRPK